MNRTIYLGLVGLLLAACAPDVPAAPSFQQDIQPILAANCVRCHGTPAIGGAPSGFRLDMFEDVEVIDPSGVGLITIAGAKSQSSRIAARAAAGEMPPRFPLDDWQIEMLENWEANPVRGTRADNRAPTASVEAIEDEVVEETPGIRRFVTITVRVDDPDPDIVGGVLRARLGATVYPIGMIHSGINRIRWETTAIAAGEFTLDAVLDDGGVVVTVALGSLEVNP
ncbi:MAG: hypothetical protein H0T89_36070 [Deltaproteobacteria bacterium]|nr:hypothetical protein [Deltaproteobacteria bacterium]MDQ3299457.1 hypothetical protein [Myxococcota bacterium]